MARFELALLLGFATVSLAVGVHAEDGYNDANTQKALQETQSMLRDRSQREEAFKRDPNQKATDANFQQALGDKETADEVYNLTSEIFPSILKAADGDANKAMQLMSQMQRNPASLRQYLTDEQYTKLQAIAKKVESKQSSVPVNH